MSNLASLRAVLKARLHMSSPYIDGAIGDAMRFVRNEELWFNAGKHVFTTLPSQFEYALPDDFLNIRGELWCIPSTAVNGDIRYKISRRTADEVENYKFAAHDLDFGIAGFTTGLPRIAAVDYTGRRIIIAPSPTDGGDDISFWYTKDLGTPRYTASVGSSTPPSQTSVFTLTGPGGEALPSTFTSPWFKEGFALLVARASAELWKHYHGGTEESMTKAQAAMEEYSEELRRLWGETANKESIVQVRRYI